MYILGVYSGGLHTGGYNLRVKYMCHLQSACMLLFRNADSRQDGKAAIYKGFQKGSLLACALQHHCAGVCSVDHCARVWSMAPLSVFTLSVLVVEPSPLQDKMTCTALPVAPASQWNHLSLFPLLPRQKLRGDATVRMCSAAPLHKGVLYGTTVLECALRQG